MNSIRKRLLSSILSVVLLITILLAVATFFSIRHELDELYDENMKQVAIVLAKTGINDSTASMQYSSITQSLHGEEEFLIQIWRGNTLKYISHPGIPFPFQNSPDGFGSVVFHKKEWRYYSLNHQGETIQITQDLHKRHSVIGEIYRIIAIPVVLQLPLLAGLVWLMIGVGLRPLERLSLLIRARSPSFLEPLPAEQIPSEISAFVVALNDLLKRLKNALEIQRQFTADAAHELRTPLTVIRLQLDILKRAKELNEKEEALESLEKGVNRCIRLAQQLLELARQEPENAETPFARLNLTALVQDAVDQILPLAGAKNIVVSSALTPSLFVNGNAAKLAVLIANLLDNAVRYTDSNGEIKISLHSDKLMARLDIQDNGIGIKPENRSRVFDRFYRVAGTDTIGSGLGLSIVRNIAAIHGADVRILDGPDGKGTVFSVSMKLDQ